MAHGNYYKKWVIESASGHDKADKKNGRAAFLHPGGAILRHLGNMLIMINLRMKICR